METTFLITVIILLIPFLLLLALLIALIRYLWRKGNKPQSPPPFNG